MANRLNGKSAVVIGAASGMGRATAIAYLKEGANVVAADIHEGRLEELAAEVAELGLSKQFTYTVCNVVNSEDCANVLEVCGKTFGTCNVLTSTVGILDNFSRVGDIDDAVWDRCLAVNCTGVMHVLRAGIRYFLAHEIPASVVIVTSDAVGQQATGAASYSASKCGASGLISAAAFEYSFQGIRFNQICPGKIGDTKLIESVASYGGIDQAGRECHVSRGYNAHKAEWVTKDCGTSMDIANVAVFLASDESDFVNNQRIMVNGGLNLG